MLYCCRTGWRHYECWWDQIRQGWFHDAFPLLRSLKLLTTKCLLQQTGQNVNFWRGCSILSILVQRSIITEEEQRTAWKLSFLKVIRSGFEPETHSLEGCCSIQLSYRTRSVFPTNGKSGLRLEGHNHKCPLRQNRAQRYCFFLNYANKFVLFCVFTPLFLQKSIKKLG